MHAGRIRNYLGPLFLLAAFFFIPSLSWGQETGSFIPTITSYDGEFDVDGIRETHDNTIAGRNAFKTSDTAFIERITLSAAGFVYHPRFIIYLASISGGLKEESIENSSTRGAGWNTAFAVDYSLKMLILPEHPYNLELYTLRRTPLVRGLLREASVNYTHGAIFKYLYTPWEVDVSWGLSSTISDQSTLDATTYRAAVTHYIGYMSTTASFYRTDSTGSVTSTIAPFESKNATNNYALENRLGYKKITLSSKVNLSDFSQENSKSPPRSIDRLVWTENLNVQLPWNFNAGASYMHIRDSQKTGASAISPEDTETSVLDNAGLNITHRLFRSLATNYNLNYLTSRFSNGESRTLGNHFGVSYNKKIPGGTMLLNANYGISTIDLKGAPTVINEIHNAQILQDFTLESDHIDQDSIVILVKDPVTGSLFTMQLGVHYSLLPNGTKTRVTILSVPPQALSPDPLFSYEFHVTYTIHPGDAKFETTTYSYLIKFSLFNNLVSPYYSHLVTKQRILSGFLTGGPEDTTTDLIGLQLQKDPFSLTGEYENIRSSFSPEKRWHVELLYGQNLTPTFTVGAKAYYSRDTLEPSPQGLSGPQATGFSENIMGGDVRLNKAFTRYRLNLSSYASYMLRTGFTRGYAYSVNEALTWLVGKLYLSLGATISYNQSETLGGKQTQLSQYYYLKLKRALF